MKKFFALFALILVAAIPLCLVGCKSKYDNLSIEMESSYEIVLGESSDDSITIEARVSGSSDENGGRLSFSPDNDKLVKISQEYKNGINYITLKALAPGKVNIEARTLEGGVTKTFAVNIIQPIKNFTVKSGDFWVVRGGEWKIDVEKNLNLEPTNTTQTDFVVSFGANQDITGLEIENNILKVSKDSIQNEIVLSVQSASNSDIAPKEIKLEVLDKFVEIDKDTQATQSRFDDGDILIFEKNESMLTYNKLEELNIISNLLSESEKEVVVRVYSSREVDVNFETNSKLAVKKISSSKTFKTNGQVEYTDFVFSVRFADTVSSGTTTSLNFVASFVGFDLKKQLSEITVAYELAPKTILVNDQDDLSEFTLYNFYSTAKKGQKLQFGVLPTSVSSDNSKMVLLNKDNFENVFDYLQFFRNNGEEFFEGDTINAGEIIYARAKSGVRTGSFEVLLQTKFVNPQTNAPISKVLKFNVLSGITEMNFENDEQINLQLNSAQNSAEILFDVAPANIDITKIHVEEISGLAFSTIAVKSQSAEGLTLRFVVSAKNVGNYRIKVYSENGIEITKDIRVVNALEDVVLSVQSPNENSVVGDRQIVGGELRYVAVSLGGAIPLEENISPSNSSYRVEYSYFEVDAMPEYALSSYDYPNMVTSTSVGVLDYSQLLGYKKIVALKQGYAVIRAKYVPIGIVDNQDAELEPIYKYFIVQGYRPIRTVVMSSNYETLYSLRSVGVFNKHLTMTKVQLSVYPLDATYANSIVWDYDNSGEYFVFDEENLVVYATKHYAGTISIVATIKELNRTYTQTLSITILDAKTVSDISVSGIGDSIYIENVDDTTKTFNINAIAFPNDAYNTKLRYDFVDQSGNVFGDIKISNDGLMTIPAGLGLSGYVRIAAEDCFQENASTGEYQPVGTEGKNIILIPTIIANGTSKDTAIKINSKEELQKIDTKKHYKIQNNLDVSGISFENFSGGLYGNNAESRVVLSGFDRTFIQTLAKTGRLEDLQIDGNIQMFGENGVLVGKNEGYINNVVATGNWSGSLGLVGVNAGKIYNTTSEVVFDGEKFGGIALSNSGEIYNCSFMGSFTASNQAAGIVISNSGLLEACSTLIVEGSAIKLSSTFAPQAKIAGVCVDNLESGRILRSYIHSYKTDAAFVGSDFSFVGGLVHTNFGSITKSFSALLGSDLITGFVYVNNAGASIENCYSNTTFANFNYGYISKCFSVQNDERLNASTSCYSGANATEKTVADWLKTDWDISCTYEKTTIWKIYLDSQNPYLREISAEVKPESMTISVKEPRNANAYLKLNETQVLLYRYESQVSPLTTAEKAKLNQYNSISIYDLLTFEILPYNASSSPDMFNYSLSEGTALSVSGLNINVLGLGKQTLTITSKLNSELSFTLDIYTSYPIRDFNIYASSSSLDPSGALNDGSIIYLKRTYTQALYSKISSSIVLVDREIEFKTHDIKVNYASETESKPMGLYLLKFEDKQTIDDFACSLNFADVALYEAFDEIKPGLSNFFARTFKVVVYNGAESLSVSQNSFEMEPIDTIELDVSLTTDISNKILFNEFGGKAISYEIYNEAGVNYTDSFHIDYLLIDPKINDNEQNSEETIFRTFDIKLSIQLRERTTQISGNYYIRIYANEEEFTTFGIAPVDVAIKLLPQSIQRVDYSHYYASSVVEDGKEVLESNTSPSNSLAPGQVGLLEVNLFPTYSEISYVEIESIPNQDRTVKLQLYQRFEDSLNRFTMVQQSIDYSRTENGIIVGYSMITDGTIYVKTQVASDIPEELTFELIVRAYKSKDDKNPVEQHIFLAAKFIPSASVEVDGQKDYIVMGRGTRKDMTITVVGEGDVEIRAQDDASSTNVYERAYVGQKTLTGLTNLGTQNQYTYSCPIFVGSKFSNEKQDVVRIEVVVSREVNGVREQKTTTLVVRVLDFVVNKVALTNGTDKYSSKVSVKTKLEFSYDITEPQTFTNEKADADAVENLKNNIEKFKNFQYFTTFGNDNAYTYEKSFMYVDEFGDHAFAIKDGDGYIYDINQFIKVEDIKKVIKNNQEEYMYTTLTGLKTGTQKMKFKVSAFSDEKEIYSITYDFDVVVTNYSNEDKPMPIGSLEDFNAIFEQSDAQDYILTNDIEISDLTPYSDTTKIRSLDGNNHKITIKSLNLGENQSLEVALFNTISEITTIKNLIVDYQIGEINANSSEFASISAAGLAINNEGIVTNTHVLSMQNASTATTGGIQISNSVAQSTQIQMAGFVLNNSGSITNSRVGDTSVSIVDDNGRREEKPLKIFALVGQDQMAGFVLNNTGIISASYAKNITIVNNSSFETNNQTAGFVLNNQSGAKITGSYVRGVEGINQTEVYVEGQGIESAFEVAGFVYDNFSYISDCYSNIKLYKETALENRKGVRSAGFVYRNEIGAQIVSSLSLSKIIEDDTSQEQFCGVDGENQSNNFGTITYSYYYSKLGKQQSIEDGSELLNASAVKLEDHFYGYSFTTLGALDGMWSMTSRGPELVSANNIALSKRYLISTEEDKYDVAYVAGFEYGSINNPILIRSAQEFNDVFGTSKDDSIKKFYDSSKKEAFGNYKIINDIDMSDLSLGGDEITMLSSTAYTFMRKTDEFGAVVGYGVLEGNSMTISNLDFSITDTDQIYFGLFSSIKNGAVVKNLNLTVKEISASSVNYVGSLAGFVENSKIINVSAEIAQNQQIALVQGRNVVGGVVGAVAGTSELNNINSSVSAHATYVDDSRVSAVNKKGNTFVQVAIPTLPTENVGLNSTVSIAGSIAGAIYAKDINNPSNANLSTIVNAQVKKIKASGKFTISAKIAGGLVGYVGKTTYIHDAWLSIADGQNINAHDYGVAGGAVGLSYGKLSHIRIEHNDVQNYTSSADNLQREIEENVNNYYENKSNERKTYENMFNSSNLGQTLGGIVGVMNGGYLEDSYTKLDVISDSAYNLGGIVGIVKNQKYEISRVYTFSNVASKSKQTNILVGGIFGAVLSSGELDTVVGANYLDKNYNAAESAKNKFVTFEPFAGACTYVPVMNNVYTLDSVYELVGLEIKGADISSSKSVVTLKTNLKGLFPASANARHVNEVFEIEDSHFKNAFWSRNVDEVFPHLTFGLEEQYYIIDDIETANDIRKMLKNSNKTFYIDGRVSMNSPEVVRAVKEVRETIIFTGKLLGIPETMNPTHKDQTPTLVGMQELFNQAVGATFADFVIENPQSSTSTLPSENCGSLLGNAKDCVFSNVKVVGDELRTSISANFDINAKNTNAGGLVGLAEGKSSFENISVENIVIQAGKEQNIGLIAGNVSSSSYYYTTFRNCSVANSSITSSVSSALSNTNVGGLVGFADGVVLTNNENYLINGITINVAAENVGGLIGNCDKATINASISKIQINVKDKAQCVGGIVGRADQLSMTVGSSIILTSNNSTEEDYGKISAKGTETIYVGGIVGRVYSTASISATTGFDVDFQTNDITVSAPSVYAGVVCGRANSILVSNLKVNTQGKIKNKAMTINCGGDVFAGGIVGASSQANISNCWSGTDVNIAEVTKYSNITFGGIVGEISDAQSGVTVDSNISYGRFFVDLNINPNTINAGGIAGSIQTSGTTKIIVVSNNKTLTSLEIRRHATNKNGHNVNAVVGNRSSKIGGTGNAYTYQLSLSVESDTNFATNCNTLSGVEIPASGDEGSILNPINVKDGMDIGGNLYYQINPQDSDIKTLNFLNENYVLVGNGKSIKLDNSHIDAINERTIIAGLTIEGKFDYDVSASSASDGKVIVKINGVNYTYSSIGLTTEDGTVTYSFEDARVLGDKKSIETTQITKYFYVDGTDEKEVDLSGENKEVTINDIKYFVININGANFAVNEAKDRIWLYTSITKYSIDRDGATIEFGEEDRCNVAKIGDEIKQVVAKEDGYYVDDQKIEEGDLLQGVKLDGNIYLVETVEDDLEVVIGEKRYKINIEDIPSISEERELKQKTSVVKTVDGKQMTYSRTETIDGIEYEIVKIEGIDYAKISDAEVAQILNKKKIKVGETIFTYQNGKLINDITGEEIAISNSGAYEQAQGFVTENKGYISGVVVKSNYLSSNFAGFVTTNNGLVVYSSMNGQVSSASGNVAGFVLENNGIIDYCHSTGAVQGNTTKSYSFGVNASTGALTNSYSIMLNETNAGQKFVFENAESAVEFNNNEYDPIATEIDLGETKIGGKVVVSNKLTGSLIIDKNDLAIMTTDGFWAVYKIRGGEVAYNYGYKTLNAGPFEQIEYLSIKTGKGSKDDPFIIANSRLLQKIDNLEIKTDGKWTASCSYSVANDINLSKNPDCANWNISNWFLNASFDGNNKTISNLSYKNYAGKHDFEDIVDGKEYRPLQYASDKYVNNNIDLLNSFGGLFSRVSDSTIKNIVLSNIQVDVVTVTNDDLPNTFPLCIHDAYVGGLVGYAKETNIDNVKVLSTANSRNESTKCRGGITAEAKTKAFVGGIVGYYVLDRSYSQCKITNCEVDSSVKLTAYNTFSNNQAADSERLGDIWVGFNASNIAQNYQAIAGGIVGCCEYRGEYISGYSSTYYSNPEVIVKFVQNSTNNTTDMTTRVIDRSGYFNQSETIRSYEIGGTNINLNLADLAPKKITISKAKNTDGEISQTTRDYIEIGDHAATTRYMAINATNANIGNLNINDYKYQYYTFKYQLARLCMGGNRGDIHGNKTDCAYNWAGVVYEKNGKYDDDYLVIRNNPNRKINTKDDEGSWTGNWNVIYSINARKGRKIDSISANDALIAYNGTYEKTKFGGALGEFITPDKEWISDGRVIWLQNFILNRSSAEWSTNFEMEK